MISLLHLNQNVTFWFQIYYQNYSSAEPKLLKLPSCDEFCPLSDFTRLLDQYIPEDDACGVID
jgi:hypothetical protein